ncbi:MAG TPA: diguanylate cyclase [Longimicrobium sp.]|nr:diguanylate cyclase [Longimicrobium sp.]
MDTTSAAPAPPAETVASLCARALALRHREPGAAVELAECAVAAADALGDAGERRRARGALGGCLSLVPDEVLRARDMLHAVVRECQEAGDDALRCQALNELAANHVVPQEHAQAAHHARAALELARALGDRREEARALRLLGTARAGTGEFVPALEDLLAALAAHDAAADAGGALDDAARWERATLFGRIAVVYSNMGQPEQAISYYQVSRDTFGERYPAQAAQTLYRMGIAAEELGDLDRAEAFHHESVRRNEALGEQEERALGMLGLCTVANLRGQWRDARAMLEEVMRVLGASPVHRSYYSDALWAMADAEFGLGRPAEALDCLRRALPVFEDARRPAAHRAHLHQRFSRIHRALGEMEQALDHFERFHELMMRHLQEQADSRMSEMMARFDTERALKDAEISRLRSVELEREIAERRQVEAALARAKEELEATNRELHALTIRDPLTGLFNRRHLDERFAEAFALARRGAMPLSVMICDLDDFKRINDTYSHGVGDEVLRAVAGILRRNVRQSDLVARVGGEEFVVLFPATTLEQAAAACEKLREQVAAHPWSDIRPGLAVTLSIGLAAAGEHATHEKLLSDADRNLYHAKRQGKNRVVA